MTIAVCLRSKMFPHFLNILEKREGDVCYDQVPTPYVDAVSKMIRSPLKPLVSRSSPTGERDRRAIKGDGLEPLKRNF